VALPVFLSVYVVLYLQWNLFIETKVFSASDSWTYLSNRTREVVDMYLLTRAPPFFLCSKAGARIVFVGSRAGTLSILQPQLQHKFADPNLTQDQLGQLMEEFPKEVSPLPPGSTHLRNLEVEIHEVECPFYGTALFCRRNLLRSAPREP
jgi:hypothetical protein